MMVVGIINFACCMRINFCENNKELERNEMMIQTILAGIFTIVGTILGWTLNGIRENLNRKVKLCFQLQITEDQNELPPLECRTKTSESGFGLEIYNIGQTPVFIDYVRLYYRKTIIVDCFMTELRLMPYEKSTYNLMMQDYDAILYHCKKLNVKKCKVAAYDVIGKREKGELDISWLQEPFCGEE